MYKKNNNLCFYYKGYFKKILFNVKFIYDKI